MKAHPGPAYNPQHYTRGYSRELVAEHVGECLSIFHELDEEHGIPEPIAVAVFSVIQTMVAAVEPVAGTPAASRVAIPESGADAILRAGLRG